MEGLYTRGWCVVDTAIDPIYMTEQFFDFLELCPSFLRNDPETWIDKNLPSRVHGILKCYVGYAPFIWKIREQVKSIFADIWQTEDIITSYDGACFLPRNTRGGTKTDKTWFHVDQNRIHTEFISVQGIVALSPHGKDDGGTLLLDGSCNYFSKYFRKHPDRGLGTFNPVDETDPIFRDCPAVKPVLEPGQMLLFDSRTVHCNQKPKKNSIVPARMAVYVSMYPRKSISEKVMKERERAFSQKRMTNHCLYDGYFNVLEVHQRYGYRPSYKLEDSRIPFLEIKDMNEIQKSLI